MYYKINKYVCVFVFRSIQVHVRVDAIFIRNTDDGQQQPVVAYFSTPVQDVDPTNHFDLDAIAANLSSQVEHWNARGRTCDSVIHYAIVFNFFIF